jgi:hypothetical protein
MSDDQKAGYILMISKVKEDSELVLNHFILTECGRTIKTVPF